MESGWQHIFNEALSSDAPTERLRDVVASLVRGGTEREQIRQELEALRVQLQEQGRDEAEDVVLEVLDFLTGWSSPHMKIL